jgi:hypothetical protein
MRVRSFYPCRNIQKIMRTTGNHPAQEARGEVQGYGTTIAEIGILNK